MARGARSAHTRRRPRRRQQLTPCLKSDRAPPPSWTRLRSKPRQRAERPSRAPGASTRSWRTPLFSALSPARYPAGAGRAPQGLVYFSCLWPLRCCSRPLAAFPLRRVANERGHLAQLERKKN
eukprot:626111-Alexandrium_andersonii.AAC.1